MADTFGAFCWIDFVEIFTHVNVFVRALGLAHVAALWIIAGCAQLSLFQTREFFMELSHN